MRWTVPFVPDTFSFAFSFENAGSIIATCDQGVYNRDFQSAGFFGEGLFVAVLLLKPLINPRHEQHVPQPGLDRAGAGEKFVGDEIADDTDAEFVPRVPLTE